MAQNNRTEWRGFSNIPLTPSQKKAVKKLAWTPAEAFLYLEAMAAEGYKMTVTEDLENTAFTVSATGTVENPGLTMTQRHNDLVTAVAAHYVAHNQVANRQWPDPMMPLFDLDW